MFRRNLLPPLRKVEQCMCTIIAKLLGYSNYNYIEFILIDQEVSFIFNLFKMIECLDITNYLYNESFSFIPGTGITVWLCILVYIMGCNNSLLIFTYLHLKQITAVHKICKTKSCYVLISPIIIRQSKTSWKYLQTHKVDMVK